MFKRQTLPGIPERPTPPRIFVLGYRWERVVSYGPHIPAVTRIAARESIPASLTGVVGINFFVFLNAAMHQCRLVYGIDERAR